MITKLLIPHHQFIDLCQDIFLKPLIHYSLNNDHFNHKTQTMKKNNTIWLLLLALSSIFASCKKESTKITEEQLPPETQTGAYTFGCKVDGKIYTASGKEGLLATQYVYYNIRSSDSSINVGVSNSKTNFNFHFSIKYLGATGIYLAKTYPYIASFQDNANGSIPGSSNVYETNDNNIGKVNIKFFNGSLSPVQPGNILAGTFEMDAVNANGKVIHITEGRFDIGF